MADRVVEVILRANVAQYRSSMMSAAASTEAAMARASRASSRHEAAFAAGAAVLKVGALGIAGGIAVAAAASMNFEARMANVKTLAHASSAEMKVLRAAAMNVGTGYGYTADQVAEAQAEMIKAGVSLKDMMGGGLKGTLALAAAGQLDVADATTIAASAMTQFRLKGADLPHVADLLAAGADKALGSVQDLGYGLSQVGTTAHQSGLSIEQTTGTLAAFAQAGLIGERGGTTFKMMLMRLENPTKKAQGVLDQYGLSLYKTNGQIKSMPELAANLQRSFEHLTPAQRNAALGTIFGARAIQGANIMMSEGSKGMTSWIRKVNDQGFAAEQAGGKLDSLKGDLQKLKAAGENALIDLGTGSQSPLRGLVQGVTSDINKITKNGDLKRWGQEIGHDLHLLMTDAAPLARNVGGALKTVGTGVKDVVEGFNKLPKGVQSALVTGGALALTAKKFGGGSLLNTMVGGGLGRGAVTALAGRAGVTPVVVTNWPAGFGPGGPGGTGPTVLGGATKAGAGSLIGRGLRSNLGFAAMETGALVVHNTVPGLGGTAATGALVGAGIGGRVGGVPGAVVGGIAGGVIATGRYKDPTETAYEKSMAARKKNAQQLMDAYQKLEKRQKELHSSDSSWMPPAAVINADKMRLVMGQLEKATGKTSKQLKDQMHGVASMDEMNTKSRYTYEGLAAATSKVGISAGDTAKMLHSLPAYVETQIKTPGTLQSKKQIMDLARQFHLTPKQIRTIMTLVGARDATNYTKTIKDGLKSLPKNVQTKIKAEGGVTSLKQIANLAQAYHLTPRQVATLVKILGAEKAKNQVDDVQKGARKLNQTTARPKVVPQGTEATNTKLDKNTRGMRKLNQQTAHPHVELQGADKAVGDARRVTGALNGVPRNVPVSINIHAYGAAAAIAQAHAAANAARISFGNAVGGFYLGGARHFADGGVNMDTGASVARVPQLRQGGGTVVWNETGEVPWEAYISGKPGMRARNQQILSMAADRLGVHRYANGGVSDKETTKAHHSLAHEVKSVTKELRHFTDALKTARTSRKEYAGTVAQAFTTDPFGGTLGGFRGQVAYESKRLRGAKSDLTALHAHGLGGSLFKDLAASGNANLIHQFAGLSKSQLAREQASYGTEKRLITQVGNIAASSVYDKRVAELSHEVHGLTRELHALRHGHHIGNTNINRVTIKDSATKKRVTAAARLRHA